MSPNFIHFLAVFSLLFISAPSHSTETRVQKIAQKLGCSQLFDDFSLAKKHRIGQVVAPKSVEELQNLLRSSDLPVSVLGGGFSQGGQTAVSDGIVVDMGNIDEVVEYSPGDKTIRVQGGASWKQVQQTIYGDRLAVKVMQSYNNFSVGGSLSVNVHGRYVGYGPVISSVREIKVMMADGRILTANREMNSDLFFGTIGGYGAMGIIVEAELDLVDDVKLEREVTEIKVAGREMDLEAAVQKYVRHLQEDVLSSDDAVMTNADLYPPNYGTIHSITYRETDGPLTVLENLQEPSAGRMAKLRSAVINSLEQLIKKVKVYRETTYAPKALAEDRVVLRNWEASYDVSELSPLNEQIPFLKKIFGFSDRRALLQEYFIPIDRLAEFTPKMVEIFKKHGVNVSNVSFRHVPKNDESMLSWSKEDMVALVIYYAQPYGKDRDANLDSARVWTQEMIDEIIAVAGSFYLPYQIYATRDQFEAAYPRHAEFYATKAKYDPTGRFSNQLIERYEPIEQSYVYRDVMADDHLKIKLRNFFKYIYSLYDPDQYLAAIDQTLANLRAQGRDLNDRNVYEELLRVLPNYARGAIAGAVGSIGSLRVQQAELADEMQTALAQVGISDVDGYLEIGTPGRYISHLRRRINLSGQTYVAHDFKPGLLNPIDIAERTGGFGPLDPRSYTPALFRSNFVDLSNYDMIGQFDVPNESLDMVSMLIGLHHAPANKLRAFVASINRVLRPGGVFVLRDHDASDQNMPFVFLGHSAFNAGFGIDYQSEITEIRNFQRLAYWRDILRQSGFEDLGVEIYQKGDPTGNALMVFRKVNRPRTLDAYDVAFNPNDPLSMANFNSIPEWHRPQAHTYMTHPEWFFVDAFREFAHFMEHTPWYYFPFEEWIALIKKNYKDHRAFAIREGIVDTKAFAAYDEMDKGLTFAVTALFKMMGLAANQIKKGLENETPFPSTGMVVRDPGDRLQDLPDGIVEDFKQLEGNFKALQTERYMPFTEGVLAMAREGIYVENVAGNKRISAVLVTNNADLRGFEHIFGMKTVSSYQYPMPERSSLGEDRYIHSVQLDVGYLQQLVRTADELGVQILRVHDY